MSQIQEPEIEAVEGDRPTESTQEQVEPVCMADLLKQWSELQPEWCKESAASGFFLIVDLGRLYIPGKTHSKKYLGLLFSTLFSAIAQYGARIELANAVDGWHAAIGLPTVNPETYAEELRHWTTAHDSEAALAVLRAWVQFLEKAQEVAA